MKLPRYNFYVGKRVRYIYLTQNKGLTAIGTEIAARGRWTSSKLSLRPGEHIVIDLACTTTYSSVFFYGLNREYLSRTAFINKMGSIIVPPSSARYYAVTFEDSDISSAYASGDEVSFIYLTRAINPRYKELSKKCAKENRQEFFRTTLDGRITLFGTDYEHIHSANIEDQFIFLIDKRVPPNEDDPEAWEKYFRGEFSKTDCKFDLERKKCELSISPKDDYTKILNGYENTYDLVKLAPGISSINLHKRSLMQIYISGANTISNFAGGTYWENEVLEPVDNHSDLVNKYYFSNIANFNEFYVNGLGGNADGVYVGSNEVWSNGKGYRAILNRYGGNSYIPEAPTNRLILQNISTGEILGSSMTYYDGISLYDGVNAYFLKPGISIPMSVSNAMSGTADFTVEPVFAYRIYRRLLCDVDTITDSEGTKTLYDLPSNDFVSDNRNFRKCIGLAGGTVYCTSETTTTPTKYGRNDEGQYFTNQFLPLSFGSAAPLPICRSTWANASLWFAYDPYYKIWEPQLRKPYALKDSYSIADVIKALLAQIDPTLKHDATAEYSQFLYGETNPISATKFYVFLAQKTNILKGEYDQPAQKAETSFAEIMGMLRDCFRCYWFIENGKLRIEHIQFFINGGTYSANPRIQLDFTGLVDRFNKKPSTYFQSEVEYDKSELSRRYEFSWADDATELFGNVVLEVQSNYVQKDKVEEITATPFSSDVDYMLFNPSAFSSDGFALLCPIKNGDAYELPIVTATLLDENRRSYQAVAQNWYASWVYLTSQFYKYDMPARLVKCNASADIIATPKMSMTHSVEFSAQTDIDELRLIRTSVGDGKVEEFSVNLDTSLTKVKLVYEPK